MKHLPLLSMLLAAGCGVLSSSEELPVSCEGISGVSVTRLTEHPGGGREVTLRLRFADGVPAADADRDRTGCVSLERPGGGSAGTVAVAERRVNASYTLLLVDPGATARDNDLARGYVRALLRRRPPGDRIALWRWSADVSQIAPFSTDRALLEERLGAALAAAPGMPRPAADALPIVAQALSQVGGVGRDALRTIVLISGRNFGGLAEGTAARAEPHLVMWMGPATEEAQARAALPAGLRFPVSGAQDPMAAATALSARLEAYQQHGHLAIGLCTSSTAAQALSVVLREGGATPLDLPAALPENRGVACKAAPLAEGARAYPKRIELSFTPEQRAHAEEVFPNKAEKPKFPLSVRLAPEGRPVAAMASFRGDGSYTCARRNYSINIDGKAPRFPFPGAASSKFHLVAMCLDRLYLRNFTALTLMAEEGLLPVPFDMVEVAIDGATAGPYLVFENVTDALRTQTSGVTAVVRRYKTPTGSGTVPEVRWSASTDEQALESYRRILGDASVAGLMGQRLEATLRARLDLSGYLRWVALLNALGSGDYIDEVFFYATETTGTDGRRDDFHLVAGWDQDDLFTTCHFGARNALLDPAGLITCSESELDKRIFADGLVYARYVDVLEDLLDRLPPERFAAALKATADKLLRFFRDPQIRMAMVELRRINPDAQTSYDVLRTVLDAELELVNAQFVASRADLLAKIARFRAGRRN